MHTRISLKDYGQEICKAYLRHNKEGGRVAMGTIKDTIGEISHEFERLSIVISYMNGRSTSCKLRMKFTTTSIKENFI